MTQRARGCALLSIIMTLAIGCGGTALNDSAGSLGGAAGASARAGASGTAGASSAGASNSGGNGVSGAASLGACSQPEQPGNCDAYAPSFWHDPNSGLCEPFVYGGCGGNDNRFPTREACLAACPGGGTDWGACKLNEDCAAISASCCEPCEPVDIQQLVAVGQAHVSDHENLHCASSGACAPCPSAGELVETRKYFKAVCAAGQCSIIDLRQTAFTDCRTDTDCVLTSSTGCCGACGGTSGFLGVNKTANLCDTTEISCPVCASPTPPKGLGTNCNLGKCVLSTLL